MEVHISVGGDILALLEVIFAAGRRCRGIPDERQHQELQGIRDRVAVDDRQLPQDQGDYNCVIYFSFMLL